MEYSTYFGIRVYISLYFFSNITNNISKLSQSEINTQLKQLNENIEVNSESYRIIQIYVY